jgi:hypothetical protein
LRADIQGLSAEAEGELRRRLALRDGETLDYEGFLKELKRIHEIVQEFDPHLRDDRAVGRAARNLGADGKVMPPDSMDVTLIISVRE